VNQGRVTVGPATTGPLYGSPAPSLATRGSPAAAAEARLPRRPSSIAWLAALIAAVVAFGAWTLSRRLAQARDKIADAVLVESQIAAA
jgi:hypothetical protein